jgi:hypothetical protein
LKTCTLCEVEKPYDQYTKKRRNKDGLMAMCRECSLPRRRQQYEENPETQRQAVYNRRSDVAGRVMQLKIETPCFDCDKYYPSYVMDFDHVRGVKKSGVSKLVAKNSPWEEIQEEIDKCELVCANCHRERTFRRKGVSQLDYYHEDY